MHQRPFQFDTTMGGSPLLEIAPTTTRKTGTGARKDNRMNNSSNNPCVGLITVHGRGRSLHHCYAGTSSSVQGTDTEHYRSDINVEARKVHFTVTIKKQEILNLDDYTTKEKTNCWYTADEKSKIAAKARKTAARMGAGKPEKVRPYRGLEHWTEQGANRFNHQVSLVMDGVMDEQESQWDADCGNDHDRIASICRALTAPCSHRARNIALEDQEVAMSIRQSMFDDTSSSCLTEDDSVVSFAHTIAIKRREEQIRRQGERSVEGVARTEESKSLQRRKRRGQRRREQDNNKQSCQQRQLQQDPPGEKQVYGGHKNIKNKKNIMMSPTNDKQQRQQHQPSAPLKTPSFFKKLRKITGVRKQQVSAMTA